MTSKSRSASYTNEEDMLLCHVYLDISQDTIKDINQSKDQFWNRIETNYDDSKPSHMQERNKRSLQCRMGVIMPSVSKFISCIRQVEQLNPSGASEEDIMNRARQLMTQDKSFTKGFKFDHVWSIMKDVEKFTANSSRKNFEHGVISLNSSQSDTQGMDSPISTSPGLSSFQLNMSDENVSGGSSQRLLGVKKSKMKKKQDDNYLHMIETMRSERQEILDVLKQGSIDKQHSNRIQLGRLQNEKEKIEIKKKMMGMKNKEIELGTYHDDTQILMLDLRSIEYPSMREKFRLEQDLILRKREEIEHEKNDNNFRNFFGDIGGSAPDLPDF